VCDGELLLKACDETPGDRTPVLALGDWCDEQGWPESAEMLRSGLGLIGGGYGDGGGGGGVGDGGVGDGGGGGYGDGDGGGYGDGDGGYKLSRGFTMRSGLYIVCSPGGYYPYVRVGWLSRDDGLIRLRNCRVVRRFGTDAQLAEIAKTGPKSNTQLLAAADEEFTSVGLISRAIPCDPKAWREHCPKPVGEAVAV